MSVRPGAKEWSASGGPTGVLLCHGLTGSPAALRPLAETLATAGHTVELPRLPGHGVHWRDLALTRWDDWLFAAQRALLRLVDRCSAVVVGGLSMGAALALRLAELESPSVAGVIAINPIVLVRDWRLAALPLLRHVLPSVPGVSNDIRKPGADEIADERLPLSALHSLVRAFPAVVDALPSITAPVLLALSTVDHTVHPDSGRLVQERLRNATVTHLQLRDSWHVATLDHDAALLEKACVSFVAAVAR